MSRVAVLAESLFWVWMGLAFLDFFTSDNRVVSMGDLVIATVFLATSWIIEEIQKK